MEPARASSSAQEGQAWKPREGPRAGAASLGDPAPTALAVLIKSGVALKV